MHVGASGARDVLRGFVALVRTLAAGGPNSASSEAILAEILAAHEPWANATEPLCFEHRDRAWLWDGQRLPTDTDGFIELAEFADRLTGFRVGGLEFSAVLPAADWLRSAIQLAFAPADASRDQLVDRLAGAGVVHTRLLPWDEAPASGSGKPRWSNVSEAAPADIERRLRASVVARQGFLGMDGCRGVGADRCRWIVRSVVDAILAEPVLTPLLQELLGGNPTVYGRAARACVYAVLSASHDGLPIEVVQAVGVAALLRQPALGGAEPAVAFADVLALDPSSAMVGWLACSLLPTASSPGACPALGIAPRVSCAEAFEGMATTHPDASIQELAQALVSERGVPPEWVEPLEAVLTPLANGSVESPL